MPKLMIKNAKYMEAPTKLAIVSAQYQSILENRLAPFGLTMPQLSVLSHVARKREALRITDIARAVQVGQPAVTKMIAKFASSGWITLTSDPNDKRVKKAEITREGGEHLMRLQTSLMPEMPEFLASWDQAELDAFLSNLTKFISFLNSLSELDARA